MPTCSTCNDRRVIRHSPSPNTEFVWIRCPSCNPDPVSETTHVSEEVGSVDTDTSVTEELLTFRAICEMIMCADPTPLSRADDARVTTWADARANEYGYPGWIAAYHQIGQP